MKFVGRISRMGKNRLIINIPAEQLGEAEKLVGKTLIITLVEIKL